MKENKRMDLINKTGGMYISLFECSESERHVNSDQIISCFFQKRFENQLTRSLISLISTVVVFFHVNIN